ncbi:MAG: type II toxin-antitoxin system VapC family toxin [Anaerolineae bacterium]|nr:type II toxin-antitoxin system VapC family toxin [Anaerolineae bacterium]
MTVGKAFVDTNVLLRAVNDALPLHGEADEPVRRMRHNGYELWISRQIIREYLSQVTRPGFFIQPMVMEQVDQQVRVMRVLFKIADETEAVTTQLLALLRAFPTGGKQIHDANIVATMLVYGIDTLLTQNVADMKRFASRIQIVPLTQNS